jgi:hypothetical protein
VAAGAQAARTMLAMINKLKTDNIRFIGFLLLRNFKYLGILVVCSN